ncbi:MAG: YggS family pyridoxal phosphate-dependent enzyme [Clostridia bacterium]|nr:YggS family pyridoxal phosphate-dependent enzyme [Clostridia bacterium]
MIDLVALQKVREQVASVGREVVLVGATKTQSKAVVDEFMTIAPDFVLGENRVQELIDKYDPAYKWHFIGRLQRNKVKYIIDKAELIHSLDRIELADEIERQASKRQKVQNCLVEINIGCESSKGGIEPEDVEEFIISLKNHTHIKIEGIMSVLPNVDTAELEILYDKLDDIFDRVKKIQQSNVEIKYYSAGMSGDYEIALKHKANVLRLGKILFGERTVAK